MELGLKSFVFLPGDGDIIFEEYLVQLYEVNVHKAEIKIISNSLAQPKVGAEFFGWWWKKRNGYPDLQINCFGRLSKFQISNECDIELLTTHFFLIKLKCSGKYTPQTFGTGNGCVRRTVIKWNPKKEAEEIFKVMLYCFIQTACERNEFQSFVRALFEGI
jgi:hypothetical protein